MNMVRLSWKPVYENIYGYQNNAKTLKTEMGVQISSPYIPSLG